MNVLVLSENEVLELLPIKECIPLMREALIALAAGKAYQPLRTIIRPSDAKGVMGLMPSYVSGERAAFGLKAICVFPGNPAQGMDAHQGAVLLYSAETGALLAMMNASAITAIRTAAVSGVATDLLAQADAGNLALIGSGVQARTHLGAMAEVRPLKRCRIASRNFEHAKHFAAEMSQLFSFAIEAVETIEEALTEADVIVTATTATEPIVNRKWIADGTHLNLVGSCIPTAREADGATMAAATLFVDRRESIINESGDYIMAARDGVIGPDSIRAEIGEVLVGDKPGRTSRGEITLFKSLGLAIEDLFAAQYLHQKALAQNAGTWIEF
jgi:ornithine cyclodeaminase